MRKIETQMNQAVANNKSWQSGNTSVSFNEETGESIVRLHGNKIAVIGEDFLQIFDGGWQSVTTKSRLNALIERFCNGVTDGVFQKNYQWFIMDNKEVKDFTSGYIFAWCTIDLVMSLNSPTVPNTFLLLLWPAALHSVCSKLVTTAMRFFRSSMLLWTTLSRQTFKIVPNTMLQSVQTLSSENNTEGRSFCPLWLYHSFIRSSTAVVDIMGVRYKKAMGT